jgi:hypothetical protein
MAAYRDAWVFYYCDPPIPRVPGRYFIIWGGAYVWPVAGGGHCCEGVTQKARSLSEYMKCLCVSWYSKDKDMDVSYL